MLVGVLLTALLQVRFQSPSCVASKGWNFAVRGRDVDKSPRWPETNDAPPLAARVAIRAARSVSSPARLAPTHANPYRLAGAVIRPAA